MIVTCSKPHASREVGLGSLSESTFTSTICRPTLGLSTDDLFEMASDLQGEVHSVYAVGLQGQAV